MKLLMPRVWDEFLLMCGAVAVIAFCYLLVILFARVVFEAWFLR